MIVAKGAALVVFGPRGILRMMSNASLVIAASRLLAFFFTYPTASLCLSASTCRVSASVCARNSG